MCYILILTAAASSQTATSAFSHTYLTCLDSRLSTTINSLTPSLTHSLTRFSGTFKQRFSDFLVWEIDESGRIAHLTTTDIQAPPPTTKTKDQPAAADPAPAVEVRVNTITS